MARLRGWIDAARDDLRTQRRLQAAAADWTAADHDPSFLAGGARLDQYEAWRHDSGLAATDTEQQYLDASLEARDRAHAEETTRREREQALERRSVRRLRTLVIVLGVAALLAGSLTIFANTQARRATDEALRAERGERAATARELAAAADANLDVDPERSMLLAMAAVDTTRATDGTVRREAEEALHRAVHASRVTLRVPDVGGNLDWSPDGETFVTEGPENAGVIDIRDATTGASVRSWTAHETDINDVVFSPDGAALASVGDDGALRVWDPDTGDLRAEHAEPVRDDGESTVRGLSFSADGDLVAGVWMNDDELRVIEADTGTVVSELGDLGVILNPFRTAFSPDGDEIAVPSYDRNRVMIVDVASGRHTRSLERGAGVGNLAWSPDGRWIAAGWGVAGDDLRPHGYVFDAETGDLRATLFGHSAVVRAVDWSPDSRRLATASGDGTVRIWNVSASGGEESALLTTQGMSAGATGVAFSPDGRQVMAGDDLISRVIAWDVDEASGGEWAAMPTSHRAVEPVVPVSDGTQVLIVDDAEAPELWDPATPAAVRDYQVEGHVWMMAEGGGLLVALTHDNVVTAWDVDSGDVVFNRDDLPEVSDSM